MNKDAALIIIQIWFISVISFQETCGTIMHTRSELKKVGQREKASH